MPKSRRAWCIAAGLSGALIGAVTACGGLSPLGPTPQGEGIVIFIHADYGGTSQAVNVDVPDLERVEGPCDKHRDEDSQPTWGDCVSSVRVHPGWSATFYRDREFRGQSVTISADTPNLRTVSGPCDGSFNDCVSSIRIARTNESR
jgi:hypothetical protein